VATQIYTHVDVSRLQDEMERLDIRAALENLESDREIPGAFEGILS
jgi:hypothetical protein